MLPVASFFVPLNGIKLGLCFAKWDLLCFCGSLYPHAVEGKYWANLNDTFLVWIDLVLAQFEKSAKQTTDVDFSAISYERDWR